MASSSGGSGTGLAGCASSCAASCRDLGIPPLSSLCPLRLCGRVVVKPPPAGVGSRHCFGPSVPPQQQQHSAAHLQTVLQSYPLRKFPLHGPGLARRCTAAHARRACTTHTGVCAWPQLMSSQSSKSASVLYVSMRNQSHRGKHCREASRCRCKLSAQRAVQVVRGPTSSTPSPPPFPPSRFTYSQPPSLRAPRLPPLS